MATKSEPQIGKKLKYLDFNGVRITPKCLILRNAYDGKEYKEKIIFQNISPTPIHLRTTLPSYSAFKLKNRLTGYKLFSGLSVSVRIEYNCTNTLRNPFIESSMIIHVNDKVIHYYISVQVSEGCMYAIPRTIDFGKVNLEHLVTSKKVVISNKGFKMSKFEIDLPTNEFGLIAVPNYGFVPARGQKTVSIEFIGLQEGDFCKDIWVKCVTPFRLIVLARVVRPRFVMDYRFRSTDRYYFIKFPPIYSNCKSYRSIQFSNINTLRTCFVIVPEINGVILSYKKASECDNAYTFFTTNPIDGYLDADEKKTIKFCFYPNTGSFVRRQTFFVFFRIIPLSSTNVENISNEEIKEVDSDADLDRNTIEERRHSIFVQKEDDEDAKSETTVRTFKDGHNETNFIKICLCATVEPLKVEIGPEQINVGEVVMNTTVLFSLHIKNKNNIIPIYYRYRKTAFIDMVPPEGFLNRLESTNLNFKYSPKACQEKESRFFIIELLYLNPTDTNIIKEHLQIVGKVKINFFSKVIMPSVKPKTKFNPGITPMLTNEVGFLTENVRFNDSIKKPRQAMVTDKLKKNEENALIAFPNDRPKSLRKTNQKNEVIKTIFARIPRYVMDRDIYMLNEEEENFKKLIYKIYNDYILINRPLLHYTSPEIETTYDVEKDCACFYREDKSGKDEIEKHIIRVGYYILTPIQLFFVKVVPSVIDIGKVAFNSKLKTKIKVVNRNLFTIKVTLNTRTSYKSYFTNLPQEFPVNGSSSKTIEIEFNCVNKGKIYTIITAMVNEHHKLPVVFKANITPLDLIIDKKDIVIDMRDINMSKSINLYNIFDVPVSYVWEISTGNCFQVLPKSGTVPPNTYLTNQVYFEPDFTNRISSKLCIEIINGLKYTLSATVFIEEVDVEIFDKVIELPHIPLNIEYTSKALLMNNGYGPIIYSIRNPVPIPGIKLMPAEGILKRRSYQIINIKIHMQIVSSFECTVDIDIYNSDKPVSFIIKGSVDYPRVHMKPEVMHLRKIPAGSFDFFPFSIENKGQTMIKINYDVNLSPEFLISKSLDPCIETTITEIILYPGEKENFILKYYPIDVTMLTFYLPLIINDIFGPPIYNIAETTFPSTYLEEFEKNYSQSELNIPSIPVSFPLILVDSIAVRHILKISKNVLQFCYLKHKMYNSITSLGVVFENVSIHNLDICIRLDDMQPNFNVSTNPNKQHYRESNISITFTMEPDEKLTFTFEYTPEKRGHHEVSLPIYIRDFNNCGVFNYITLHGECPMVNIMCCEEIKWNPIPLREIITYELLVTIEYHTEVCELEVKTNEPLVKIAYPKGSKINQNKISVVIPVLLTYSSDKPYSFRSSLTISCKCGIKKVTKIMGCTDSSMLTSHLFYFENFLSQRKAAKSLSTIEKSSTAAIQTSGQKLSAILDSNTYLQKLCLTVEEWLCQQVFYGKNYFEIPEHLSELFYEHSFDQEKDKKKKNKIPKTSSKPMLLIVQILFNIVGDKHLAELAAKPVYKTEIDRIYHYHMIYINVLKFLEVQGAFLQGVQPKYMLSYDDYIIYENNIRVMKGKHPADLILDNQQFIVIGKYTWVNILLQIFKILVLPRVNKKLPSNPGISSATPDPNSKLDHESTNIKLVPEEKLLKWVTINFNKNRQKIMKLNGEPKIFLDERVVTNFNDDFSDGLVLLSLFISYVPYLENHLSNIFVDPDTTEKKFHNACIVVHVLKLIHYSYNLKPVDIVQPFPLQIIMFLTYLHEVLPYFLPVSTIRYNVSLSKSKSQKIELKNMENKVVNYTVLLLNNKLDCFSADCGSNLQIPPNKSINVYITFTAKLMSIVTSTLIFCGETVGAHYSRTIVYTLEGEPNYDEDHDVIIYKLPLYTVRKTPLTVQSPYKAVAKYKINVLHTKIIVNNTLVNAETNIGVKFKLLYVENTYVYCDENGIGEVNLTVCSLTPVSQEFWILFSDELQGDFFIKVVINMPLHNDIEKKIITLMLPSDFDNIKCICPPQNIVRHKNCPRNVVLKIPCKNDVLWNTIYEMILSTVDPNETDSWKNMLYCDTGPDLLAWFAREALQNAPLLVQHIFERAVKYNVSGPKFLGLQNVIFFDDVRHGGTVDIVVHFPDSFPTKFTINMRSTNEIELRIYEINILYKAMEENKIESGA